MQFALSASKLALPVRFSCTVLHVLLGEDNIRVKASVTHFDFTYYFETLCHVHKHKLRATSNIGAYVVLKKYSIRHGIDILDFFHMITNSAVGISLGLIVGNLYSWLVMGVTNFLL